MTIKEAAEILAEMYENAPEGEKATSVHLFGIKYAAELSGLPLTQIAERSGIGSSYGVEINKGRNLAKYVDLKPQAGNYGRR